MSLEGTRDFGLESTTRGKGRSDLCEKQLGCFYRWSMRMLERSVLVNALLNYTLKRELQLRVILVLRNMWCIDERTFGEDWMILHPVREESPNWVRDQNWRLCGQCFVENSHTICRGVTRWVNMVSFRLRCAIKKERASASEWQINDWTSSPDSSVSLGTNPTKSSSEKLESIPFFNINNRRQISELDHWYLAARFE